MATAINRLQEARRIYDSAVEASQALREQTTALEKAIAVLDDSVASLRTNLARLHDELDELAKAVADHNRVLHGAWMKMIGLMLLGGFLGALLYQAAAAAWPGLLSR